MLTAAIATTASTAGAQDLGGALDLGQLGRDQAYSSTMKNMGKPRSRAAEDRAVASEIAANCRKLRRMGRPTGPMRARYDRAMAMCRPYAR